jgi:hypothetical protein
MLLHTLRRSHTLARLVLVWFVLAMGVAIAAPAVQPLDLGGICSASALTQSQQAEAGGTADHHTLQCVLCLGVGAPPVAALAPFGANFVADVQVPHAPAVVALALRNSPLSARAPPAL